MDLETFITAVFCVVDDCFSRQELRQRGPKPVLADSEVVTIEVIGEFLGLDTDRGLYAYFRCHYGHLFPKLRLVHRTTFLRQAANLWAAKRALWRMLVEQIQSDAALSVIDSMPVPVCRFARAYRCRLFRGEAAFGHDELARQTFYGFRLHLRITWPGVITAIDLAPANASDLAVAPELLAGAEGWALADRNYWSPVLRSELAARGLTLLAPFRTAKGETPTGERRPWPHGLVATRRRIETVLGQLVERYHAKRVWARDRWHLCARWWRKILSHTLAVLFCQHAGLEPLSFAELLTE